MPVCMLLLVVPILQLTFDVQRWKPKTRSARHKLNKFIKDHEHLLQPDPDSFEGGLP